MPIDRLGRRRYSRITSSINFRSVSWYSLILDVDEGGAASTISTNTITIKCKSKNKHSTINDVDKWRYEEMDWLVESIIVCLLLFTQSNTVVGWG